VEFSRKGGRKEKKSKKKMCGGEKHVEEVSQLK
jgi:hypothetical protein